MAIEGTKIVFSEKGFLKTGTIENEDGCFYADSLGKLEKGYVGEAFTPKYYVVVLDMKEDEKGELKEEVKTVNYLKGSNRIKWSSTDESIATVDEKGVITGQNAGYTMINADTGLGNVTPINIQIAKKKKE